MNIIGTTKSWNKSTKKDCFEISAPSNLDHIYPESKGGSNGNINKQILSQEANEKKKDLTKGKITKDWRFSILKQTNKDGLVYGIMYIRNKNWNKDDWKKVIPVR